LFGLIARDDVRRAKLDSHGASGRGSLGPSIPDIDVGWLRSSTRNLLDNRVLRRAWTITV
jgi:hypothetical protein